MISKFLVVPVLIVGSISLVGCNTTPVQTAYGTMPQYCTQNNMATGAIIGTLFGAALGAAIGGGRGAAIGAASGLALGGATGAQADVECRQLAYQQAVEMAWAQHAQAMAQAAAANAAAPAQVAYQSVDYVVPSTGVRHKVTPLNSYTNPATKETCSDISDVTFGQGGGVNTSNEHQLCKGADGKVHET